MYRQMARLMSRAMPVLCTYVQEELDAWIGYYDERNCQGYIGAGYLKQSRYDQTQVAEGVHSECEKSKLSAKAMAEL
jgi:hypothetical protein